MKAFIQISIDYNLLNGIFYKMVYFLVFFLLFYRKNVKIHAFSKQLSLKSFGFTKNGNFSFDFTIPESFDDHIKLVLLNSLTYSQQERNFFGKFDLCSNKTIVNQGIIINNKTQSYSGTIKYKTVIYPFLLKCESDDSFNSKLNLLIKFQNPFTFLDLRIRPEITVQLVISIFFAILFFIYMINFFYHITFRIYLHQILTFSIVTFLTSHILRYFELIVLDKSDDSHHLTQFHLIFVWTSYFLIVLFFLFMSYGLSIINDTILIRQAIICIIISVWITFFPLLYIYHDIGPNQKYVLFLIIVGIIIFIVFMTLNIRSSSSQIIKFLMKSPHSIPEDLIYLDHRIYSWVLSCVLCVCFMITVFVILYITCPEWCTWSLELTISLIELISLSMFAYLFRLRPKRTIYKGILDEMPLANVEPNLSYGQPLLKDPIE